MNEWYSFTLQIQKSTLLAFFKLKDNKDLNQEALEKELFDLVENKLRVPSNVEIHARWEGYKN